MRLGMSQRVDFADFHFSITIRSNDLAVVGCLRALAAHSQQTISRRVPWGGTKDSDWKAASGHVTFRFTTRQYRENFRAECRRLLPADLWAETAQSDTDPARPQS